MPVTSARGTFSDRSAAGVGDAQVLGRGRAAGGDAERLERDLDVEVAAAAPAERPAQRQIRLDETRAPRRAAPPASWTRCASAASSPCAVARPPPGTDAPERSGMRPRAGQPTSCAVRLKIADLEPRGRRHRPIDDRDGAPRTPSPPARRRRCAGAAAAAATGAAAVSRGAAAGGTEHREERQRAVAPALDRDARALDATRVTFARAGHAYSTPLVSIRAAATRRRLPSDSATSRSSVFPCAETANGSRSSSRRARRSPCRPPGRARAGRGGPAPRRRRRHELDLDALRADAELPLDAHAAAARRRHVQECSGTGRRAGQLKSRASRRAPVSSRRTGGFTAPSTTVTAPPSRRLSRTVTSNAGAGPCPAPGARGPRPPPRPRAAA